MREHRGGANPLFSGAGVQRRYQSIVVLWGVRKVLRIKEKR